MNRRPILVADALGRRLNTVPPVLIGTGVLSLVIDGGGLVATVLVACSDVVWRADPERQVRAR